MFEPGKKTGRAVITGAAGALGRALAAVLAERGVPVLGLDRVAADVPGATMQACDVASARFAEIVAPGDTVFHLAAFVHRFPRTPDEVREVFEVNQHATRRLGEACLAGGASLVFVSTVAVRADTDYGRSKAAAENDLRALGAKGLRFTIVRFPLLYGPRGRGNMERMLEAIHAGRYWPIGDPGTPKSCLYVEDAARALVAASARADGETYVAGPARPPTLGEIHAAAYAAVGRTVPSVAMPRGLALAAARCLAWGARVVGRTSRLPEQIETLTAPAGFDGSAFARATGFQEQVGLAEGMRRTAAWLLGGAVADARVREVENR